ncbi:MAG: class I SAM-dependent methyltransferase [Bacteroidota bacterium]
MNTKSAVDKVSTFPLISFIRHWSQASGKYFLHSPFVYDWYRKVLRGPSSSLGEEIEALRKRLSTSQEFLSFTDLGAGQRGKNTQILGNMVQRAGRRRASGELLGRLVKYHQYTRGLELGTHVGLSSLYVNYGHSFNTFITIEGIDSLAQIARNNFTYFGISPELIVGSFDEVLDNQIELETLRPDYVFIDGNHQYGPTLAYFHRILPFIQEGGVMVFDDIYWSKGMAQAWREICANPQVSISIDLYFLGICYIKRPQAKEHFRFRFWGG